MSAIFLKLTRRMKGKSPPHLKVKDSLESPSVISVNRVLHLKRIVGFKIDFIRQQIQSRQMEAQTYTLLFTNTK